MKVLIDFTRPAAVVQVNFDPDSAADNDVAGRILETVSEVLIDRGQQIQAMEERVRERIAERTGQVTRSETESAQRNAAPAGQVLEPRTTQRA